MLLPLPILPLLIFPVLMLLLPPGRFGQPGRHCSPEPPCPGRLGRLSPPSPGRSCSPPPPCPGRFGWGRIPASGRLGLLISGLKTTSGRADEPPPPRSGRP